jgi:tRNA uridine 5-carbamoylmethylation protein Kti12
MIICLYGQPGSGKTTLAESLQKKFFQSVGLLYPHLDGDLIRTLYKNFDYSQAGRMRNLIIISDIAHYLHSRHSIVLVSAVFPYHATRNYFTQLSENIMWVCLEHNRERHEYHVEDFQTDPKEPNTLTINTSDNDVDACLNQIFDEAMIRFWGKKLE